MRNFFYALGIRTKNTTRLACHNQAAVLANTRRDVKGKGTAGGDEPSKKTTY